MRMTISTSTDMVRPDTARDTMVQRAPTPGEPKAGENRSAPGQQISRAAAEKLVTEIQEKIDAMNVSLTFSTYGRNNKIAVTVIERESGDVIREIPPKELQQLAEKLDEMIGLIFSKSA